MEDLTRRGEFGCTFGVTSLVHVTMLQLSSFFVIVKVLKISKRALLLPPYMPKLPSWMTHLEFFEQSDSVTLSTPSSSLRFFCA
jgi:hypothetical protein